MADRMVIHPAPCTDGRPTTDRPSRNNENPTNHDQEVTT
jgi:hypothetical protein